MSYKILFLDIDGTILKLDQTYDTSTKEAIDQLHAQGIEVFIATGRPLHEIEDLAESLNVHSLIGYNGAYAIYQNQVIVNELMDRTLLENYLKIAKENQHDMVLFSRDNNYFTNLDDPTIKYFTQLLMLQNNHLLEEHIHDQVLDQILGASLLNMTEEDVKLYDINEDFHLSKVNLKGTESAYDIISNHVNKGTAVQKILDRLHISKDEAIAFGDGLNDKEMLSSVGEGFAMGNASPDLLPYTNRETTTVDNHGIFNGLKKLGLVE